MLESDSPCARPAPPRPSRSAPIAGAPGPWSSRTQLAVTSEWSSDEILMRHVTTSLVEVEHRAEQVDRGRDRALRDGPRAAAVAAAAREVEVWVRAHARRDGRAVEPLELRDALAQPAPVLLLQRHELEEDE